MTQSEAQRAASRKSHKKRVEDGFQKITVWVRPENAAALVRLTTAFGSRDEAINRLIQATDAAMPGPTGE